MTTRCLTAYRAEACCPKAGRLPEGGPPARRRAACPKAGRLPEGGPLTTVPGQIASDRAAGSNPEATRKQRGHDTAITMRPRSASPSVPAGTSASVPATETSGNDARCHLQFGVSVGAGR
jgi:hypothetical protein